MKFSPSGGLGTNSELSNIFFSLKNQVVCSEAQDKTLKSSPNLILAAGLHKIIEGLWIRMNKMYTHKSPPSIGFNKFRTATRTEIMLVINLVRYQSPGCMQIHK